MSEQDWIEASPDDDLLLAETIRLEGPDISGLFVVDDIEERTEGMFRVTTYSLVRIDDDGET